MMCLPAIGEVEGATGEKAECVLQLGELQKHVFFLLRSLCRAARGATSHA